MSGLEFLFVLLIGAAALVRIADVVGVPYPIVLVIGGLAAGLIPGIPAVEMEPEVIFLVFLPPLLYSAAWDTSPKELKDQAWPLTLLAVGLVIVTMATVAVVAHALVDGMGWPAAFALGALLAPTDPASAVATFSRVGVSARLSLLVEGEALLNDAIPLVAYRVALVAAVSGSFSAGHAAWDFISAAVGGVLLGLAIGWASKHIVHRLADQTLSIFLTLLFAYGTYLLGEELHVSGVLAVVTAGVYLSWYSHEAIDADTRLSAVAFWRVLVFGLNATLFVLLGVQFPEIVEELKQHLDIGELLNAALVISLVVVVVRIAWLQLPATNFADTARERLVIGWAGMRGAISLAAVLSVPLVVEERDQMVFITVVVILVTLVGQGLTLPAVVKFLGVEGERPWSPDEAIARLEGAQAALDRIDELEESGIDEERLRRLRDLYRARFRKCMAVIGGEDEIPEEERESPERSFGSLRQELIGVERRALIGLRNDGTLGNELYRLIERDLDLEEARLRPWLRRAQPRPHARLRMPRQ